MQVFELLIGILILLVLGAFISILVKVSPDWGVVFNGFIPSSEMIDNGAVFVAVA